MMRKTPSKNGKFDLFYRKGWAHLAVHAPKGGGRPVYPEEIENRMRLLGIPRVGAKTIRDLIEEGSGTPAPLIEWPGGRALAAKITVAVAEDGMSASVAVAPPKKGAAHPTLTDVLEELGRAGVEFGIDRDCIRTMLSRQEYGKPVPVAAGIDPVFGRAYRVVHHFNTNRGRPYGETIPAESDARIVQLEAGANTLLSPDRAKLYAECDGNVRLVNGKALVEPVITVRNVNYETGNIRFDGSVVIEERIADGFIVEAGGDIQVGSSVGKATLKAAGSILLRTGMNGNGEGSIDCGGDLFAKYIESCAVTCRGNLFAEEAIMHSRVTAFGNCVLNGRRSEAIASDLVVGGSFWCKKLGNFNEAPTRLAVGVEPGLLIDYRTTAAGIVQKQEEWDKIELRIEQLEKLIKENRSDERVLPARAQLQAALDELGSEIARLRGQFPSLRERLIPSRKSIVVVEETMFKGVAVTFGTLEYRAPDAGIRKTILRVGENQVLESGFNYNERPTLDFDDRPLK